MTQPTATDLYHRSVFYEGEHVDFVKEHPTWLASLPSLDDDFENTRPMGRACGVDGCKVPANGKPYCIDHLHHLPYVASLSVDDTVEGFKFISDRG